jgi:hypothetical protein
MISAQTRSAFVARENRPCRRAITARRTKQAFVIDARPNLW